VDSLARRFLPLYGRMPDEFRAWVPRAERVIAAKLAQGTFQPDVLVTFGEPMSDHLLGFRLKRRFGIPWVAHFSDPWRDNPFRRRDVLANVFNGRQERRVIAAADRVIFTSRETIDLVMRKYPAEWRAKTRLLQHSFDPALYPDAAAPHQGFVIRHVGNFYGKRTPYPLFRALRMIHDRKPDLLDGVRFELYGGMPRGFRWHPSFRALPPGLVDIRGTIGYRESLKVMKDADLLLVMDAPDDLSVFLPSKLIDYLGSGTPVMGIVPRGTSASLLARLGGFTADPRDPQDVATALLHAITVARQRTARGVTRPWGHAAVRAEFEPRHNAAVLEEILRECVSTVPKPVPAAVDSAG
jgi:glycosyltransferase involved in cell wall biosynthesis